jgi:hypothetical protein
VFLGTPKDTYFFYNSISEKKIIYLVLGKIITKYSLVEYLFC